VTLATRIITYINNNNAITNLVLLVCDNLQLGLLDVIGGGTFCFTDRNGWPVSPEQESHLVVVDVLRNTCVRVALPPSSTHTTDGGASIVQTTSMTTKLKRSISTVTYGCKRLRYSRILNLIVFACRRLDVAISYSLQAW
jgi:hypothetical protein